MNDDEESKFQIKESRKEIIYRKLKNSIFQTYYRLIPSSLSSILFYSLLITLEFFQITGLILFDIRSSDKIDMIRLETHKFHSMYYPIKLFKISYVLFKEKSEHFSVILLYCSFIFLILHILIYIYYYLNIIEIRNQLTIYTETFFKLMFYFDLFICSFLTIPLYTIYFSFYQCDSQNNKILNFPNLSCHNWFHYFNIVISSINIFLLTFIGLLSSFFLNENHLIPKVPWNNSFSLITCLIFTEKIILSLCYIIKFDYSFHIKSIIIPILMIIHTLLRLQKHFFRVKLVGYLKSCYEFSITFFSFIGIINHFYDSLNFKLSSFFLEISTGFCFGIMLVFLVEKLNQKTLFVNSKITLTEKLCATQLLYLLQLAKEEAEDNIKTSIFLPVLQQHRIKCFDVTCRCGAYFKFIKENFNDMLEDSSYKEIKFALKRKLSIRRGSALRRNTMKKFSIHKKSQMKFDWDFPQKAEDDITYLLDFKTEDEKINKTILIYEIIRIIGENMLKTFPNCQRIKLYFSYLMVFYLGNKYRALYELMKISKQSQNLKIQYEIFLCKKEIENQMQQELKNPLYDKSYYDSSTQGISMESILDFNKLTNRMFDLVNSTSKLLIKFWQEILGFDSDLNSSDSENNFSPLEQETTTNKKNKRAVYKYAVMISKGFHKMNKIYYKLRKIDSFKSKIVFQLYFEFLEKVIFNGEQSKEIKKFINLNKYFQRDLKEENEFLIFHKDKINMDDVGSCVISADLLSLGKILNCNLQFGNIFKYEKDDLRMESINKLIPSYIADFHNDFLLRYLQKGKSHIIGKNKLLFGLRSDGLTIPIIIFVKSVPNLEKSIRFIGLVKKLSKKHFLWKPPLNLYEESQNHDYITLNMSNKKIVSFILTTISGQVYGITKNALKLFGIPLNVLLPPLNNNQFKRNLTINNNNNNEGREKIQRENEILEITHIFKGLDFGNYSQMASLKSEVGIEMTIETICLKNYFHDFRESLETSHSNLLKCLNNFDPNLSFAKHQVRLSVTEIKFNDGLTGTYLFKVILLRNNDAFINIIKRHYLQGKNEIFQNFILGSLKKQEIKNQKNKNLHSDKNSFVHVSSKSNTENNEEEKRNEIVKKSQKSLKQLTIPKQINYFFLIFFLSLLFLFIVALFEFLYSQWYSNNIFSYSEMFNLSNFRNLHLIQIILYIETLIFLDNDIYSEKEFNRTQIILKLNTEINKNLDLLSTLHSYVDTIDDEINDIFNIYSVSSYDLKKNLSIIKGTNILSNLLNQILVYINNLLDNGETIKVKDINSFFYNYLSNVTIDSVNKDIFYILYNYCFSVRFLLDKSISIMLDRFHNIKFFESSFRDYIVYIPYFILLITIILDLYILKKLADYKIGILKIFYLVNKNYGELIINRCQIFVEYTKNFTKYTKMDINKVFNNLLNKNESKEEDNESDSSKRLESNFEDDKSLSSKNILLKSIKRLKSLEGKTLFQKKEEKEKEQKQKDSKQEKLMKEKLKKELADSKKNATRKMLIILIGIILLILFHLIYFTIVILLNSKFDNRIKKTIETIFNLSNRGWMFFNFLFFYREMIISNDDNQVISDYNDITKLMEEIYTPKDLFFLYMTRIYSIETNIVLLTNRFNNGYRNKILDKTVEIENLLNSEKYCQTLKNFDENYYENFLYDCDNFYTNYNGLKDNIHIIAGYIQANVPDYKNKNISDIISIIQLNATFINYAELYISQGIFYEMKELQSGLEKFINSYRKQITIRLTIIVSIIVIEFILYVLMWKYLKKSLSNDKEILNIIPNEAIVYSQKLKAALLDLNNFK